MMRKTLLLVVMSVVMLFAGTSSVWAQAPENEYKLTLEKMLEVSGSTTSAKTMVPQMIAMMKQQSSTSAADAFWDGFQKKWEEKFGSKLAELYVPIYQKYLTLDDLKQIIAFYESPVGKRLSASTPAMMSEGMQIGQKLGMQIVTELRQELEEQGNK